MITPTIEPGSVAGAEEPLTQNAPEPWTPRRKTLRFHLYLAFWVLIPLVLYLLPLPLVRTDSFEHWSPSEWGPILDYSFTARGNADVVVFGDSSAFVGIDPRIVDQQLGIRSVVLPGTIGSLPVIGDKALEAYLSHNGPPRLLVFYFSPWHLDYKKAQAVRLFEGEEMLFRHVSREEMFQFARQNPLETLRFPVRLYTTFRLSLLSRPLRHLDAEKPIRDAQGHYDFWDDPFPALADNCSFPQELVSDESQATVEQLIGRYKTRMPVMVYIAPIPGCSNADVVARRPFPGLNAAPPAVLPPHEFIGDPYYAHIEPPFVADATQAFITVLGKRLSSTVR